MTKKNMKKEKVAVEVIGAVVENEIDTMEEMVIDSDTVVVEEELEPEQQERNLEELPLLPLNAAINSEAVTEAAIDDGMVERDEASIVADVAGLLETVVADNEAIPDFERDIMLDIQQEEAEEAQNEGEDATTFADDNRELEKSPFITNFRSDSEAARNYILELLSDGESHKKQDVVAYINQKAGKTFTDATIINVLRNLINNGDLLQLERGSYKIGTGIGLASKLLQFVDATRKGLEKITTVSISEINETDLSVVKDVKELRGLLNDIFDRLSLGSI